MNSDNPEDDFDFEASEARGFRWPFGWGVMLALGWLVFELTARPRFGIAVTCTKLMWNDLVTARWWLKRDPSLLRGVCMMLLLAIRATMKFSFTLIGMWIVVSFFENPALQPEESKLWFSFLVGYSAFFLASIIGIIITPLSLIGGIRLWLDTGVTESRRMDCFPPKPRGWNQAAWLLLGTRYVELGIVAGILYTITMMLVVNDNGLLLIVVLGMILLIFCQYHFTKRIIASTPHESLSHDEELAPSPKVDEDWG